MDSPKPKPVVRKLGTVVLMAGLFTTGAVTGWCAHRLSFVVRSWEPARQSPVSQPSEPMTKEELRKALEEWERWFSDQEDHETPYRTHGGII